MPAGSSAVPTILAVLSSQVERTVYQSVAAISGSEKGMVHVGAAAAIHDVLRSGSSRARQSCQLMMT
jgi:hypothetical protein